MNQSITSIAPPPEFWPMLRQWLLKLLAETAPEATAPRPAPKPAKKPPPTLRIDRSTADNPFDDDRARESLIDAKPRLSVLVRPASVLLYEEWQCLRVVHHYAPLTMTSLHKRSPIKGNRRSAAVYNLHRLGFIEILDVFDTKTGKVQAWVRGIGELPRNPVDDPPADLEKPIEPSALRRIVSGPF